MKDEYIIINKTAIQKRIEELKQKRELAGNLFEDVEYNHNQISTEIRVYEQILSQSTPLIPEVEKAFDAGRFAKEHKEEFTKSEIFDLECQGISYNPDLHYHNNQKYEFKDKQDYITNLKLDI